MDSAFGVVQNTPAVLLLVLGGQKDHKLARCTLLSSL